jgi:hypothetical protein
MATSMAVLRVLEAEAGLDLRRDVAMSPAIRSAIFGFVRGWQPARLPIRRGCCALSRQRHAGRCRAGKKGPWLP